jgi:molybdopterin-guanine dinucleotide biosynthesis protein A
MKRPSHERHSAGEEPLLPVAAVVLAGGASRRMRRDKALLTLPDGRTTLETVLTAARAVANPVWLAVDTAEHGERLCRALPAPGPPLLLDGEPGAGPLATLAGAMEASPTPALLALAVDTPLVRPTLLLALHEALYDEQARMLDMALPVLGGVAQPFPACYAVRLADVARRALAAGHRGPRALQREPGLRVRLLGEADLRAIDPDLHSFVSANTPDEWERLLALIPSR